MAETIGGASFHNFTNGRKARDFISLLNINGSMIEYMEQIDKELVVSYKSLYSKHPSSLKRSMVWELEREIHLGLESSMAGTGFHHWRHQNGWLRTSKGQSPEPGWFSHAFLSRMLRNQKYSPFQNFTHEKITNGINATTLIIIPKKTGASLI